MGKDGDTAAMTQHDDKPLVSSPRKRGPTITVFAMIARPVVMDPHLRGDDAEGRSSFASAISALLLAGLLFDVTTAFAQTRTLAEIAADQGPDRTQRLIEGAK